MWVVLHTHLKLTHIGKPSTSKSDYCKYLPVQCPVSILPEGDCTIFTCWLLIDWLIGLTINFTSIYTGIAASIGLVKSLVSPPVNLSPTVNSTPPVNWAPPILPNICHQQFSPNIFHPFSDKNLLSKIFHQKNLLKMSQSSRSDICTVYLVLFFRSYCKRL